MSRTLIINLARMGDIIQSSPLVMELHEAGDEVTLLVPDAFVETATAIPGVDKVVLFPMKEIVGPLLANSGGFMQTARKLNDLVEQLRRSNFRRVINITHSNYSAVLTALVGWDVTDVTGISMDREGYRVVRGDWANYYFNSCLNRNSNRFNLVDIHQSIGGVHSQKALRLEVSSQDRDDARDILSGFGEPHGKQIGLVPAASTPEKQWPPEQFAAVVSELRREFTVTPLIFGAPSESELGERLSALIPGSINLCGRTSPRQLAALMERCEICITNDTGPMHVATAVATRVIDISLGSALSHETAPYGEGHLVVEARIGCYPCLPKMKCSHLSCHRLISPMIVAQLTATLLRGDTPRIVDDAPKYSGMNIFRSAFDQDGYLALQPLIRRELTGSDLLNRAYGEIWRRTLDSRDVWQSDYSEIAESIGNELTECYKLDYRQLGLFVVETKSKFMKIAELADSGRMRASELTSLGEGHIDITKAQSLGRELKQIDEELIRLGYGNAELKPLVSQFVFGKDNLVGSEMAELARQTTELYKKLGEWSQALPVWMDEILTGAAKVAEAA